MKIHIADYDPEWPEQYESHRGIIANTLGDAALCIEHIGSTAVPGLAAKPIIDIVLVVENSAVEPSYLPQLEAAGYVLRHREPGWHEHRMLRNLAKDVHIHVYSKGCCEIQRNLIFRDRLRNNLADRNRYEGTKRALAQLDWADTQEYADAKTEIINQIVEAKKFCG
jgi:GrpB-like predicted nucleotidyltransferase (UPF0157 family)